jgi:F-type H+-transporting ATPase subunit b
MRECRVGATLLLASLLILGGVGLARAQHDGPGNDKKAPTEDKAKGEKEHAKDDAHAKDAAHGKDGHGDGHSSSILDWALEDAIWTLVVFFLLLFVLRKWAWGPMLEGLRKREDHIRLAVEEAKIARQETERVRADFKGQMDKAYAEIPKIMEEARRDAANLREEMRSKAAADIQAERDRLRREIETARDQALQELWNQTATLATLISAKAIGRSLSEEDHRRLADEALSEVQSASGQWKTELRQFGQEGSRKGGGE